MNQMLNICIYTTVKWDELKVIKKAVFKTNEYMGD